MSEPRNTVRCMECGNKANPNEYRIPFDPAGRREFVRLVHEAMQLGGHDLCETLFHALREYTASRKRRGRRDLK